MIQDMINSKIVEKCNAGKKQTTLHVNFGEDLSFSVTVRYKLGDLINILH